MVKVSVCLFKIYGRRERKKNMEKDRKERMEKQEREKEKNWRKTWERKKNMEKDW